MLDSKDFIVFRTIRAKVKHGKIATRSEHPDQFKVRANFRKIVINVFA